MTVLPRALAQNHDFETQAWGAYIFGRALSTKKGAVSTHRRVGQGIAQRAHHRASLYVINKHKKGAA